MTIWNQKHGFPPDELETNELEVVDQHICIQNWFFPPTISIEGAIHQTDVESATPPTHLNLVSEPILEVPCSVRDCFDPGLFRRDADEVAPFAERTRYGPN